MDKPNSIEKKKVKDDRYPARMDDIFENFRREIESAFSPRFPSLWDWRFPTIGFPKFEELEVRMPLCDLIDKGDKYELTLETPGIAKEKIQINATKNSIRVSGEQTEKTEEKRKNYLYNERSYKSFQRELPLPEEIIPKNIEAEMKNGVLHVSIPKKVPTKPEETESVKIDVK